jgi:hypothetical protein
VRLRPLTEAECYARCYGGRRDDSVTVLTLPPAGEHREAPVGRRLNELLAGRLRQDRTDPEREAA